MKKPSFNAYTGDEPFVFLSYAHDDSDTVLLDAEWLEREGVRIWYDDGILTGEEWARSIRDNIRKCSVVLIFLSPAALRTGSYVYTEIQLAMGFRKPFITVKLEDVPLPSHLKSMDKRQMLLRSDWERDTYLRKLREAALYFQMQAHKAGFWKRLLNPKVKRYESVLQLSKNVEESWVQGFLVPTLANSLNLTTPLRVIEESGSTYDLAADESYKLFFEGDKGEAGKTAHHRILLSGASGSGKTIQLLRFVDALLPRGSRLSRNSKIPVVLAASTWVDDPLHPEKNHASMVSWIEQQLLTQYGLPRATASKLIGDYQLIYCIDSFDELGRTWEILDFEEDQNTVADAEASAVQRERTSFELRRVFLDLLEGFMTDREGKDAGLIICSQPGSAEELRRREAFCFTEIQIGDLTTEVALDWARKENLAVVEQVILTTDANNLINTPLGLHMLAVAYPSGTSIAEAERLQRPKDPERLRQTVYDLYFRRKVTDFQAVTTATANNAQEEPVTNSGIQQYTRNIAKYLTNRGSGRAFRLDELQPYELPSNYFPLYRSLTALGVLAGICVCAAVPVGFAVGTDRYFNDEGESALVYGLLTVAGVGGAAGGTAAFAYWKFSGASAGAIIGFALAIGRAVGAGLSARVAGSQSGWHAALRHGTATLIAIPVFAWLLQRIKDDPLEIRPIEMWETDRSRAFGLSLGISILFGIVFRVLLGPARGIAFGACLALALGFRFARRPRQTPIKVQPNQAIYYTRRVAVNSALGITVVCMTIFGVTYGITIDRREGINNAMMAMTFLVSFFFFGGLSVLKHWALRRTLRKSGLLPQDDLHFLRIAAKAGLMRQVGGGFEFPHRTITDFFAAQASAVDWGTGRRSSRQ